MIDNNEKQESQVSPRTYRIRERIEELLRQAMRDRDKVMLQAYRNIKTEITVKEKEYGKPADDAAIMSLFKAMVKSRTKAIETFVQAGRQDLADENRTECNIMSQFLPAEMTDEQVKYILEDIVKISGMYRKSDMGRVMAAFSEKFPEEDKGRAASILKNILA